MKAAVLLGPGRIEVQEVDMPAPRPTEVLVNVKACAICTFDRRLFSGEKKIGGYPIVPGHEASGVVVEVGAEVRRPLEPGTRVALDLLNRCGECEFCRTGKGNLCRYMYRGKLNFLGGFGEYVAVPSEQVFPIANSVSFEEAALVEPVACTIHSLKEAAVKFSEFMLVFGVGPMGMLHVLVGRAMGLQVGVVDPDPVRRQKALQLGASVALAPMPPAELKEKIVERVGTLPDVVVTTAPIRDVAEVSIAIAQNSGRIVLFGAFPKDCHIEIDPNRIHYSELKLIGSESRTPEDFYTAARAISSGIISVRPLVSQVVQLSDVEAALSAVPSADVMRVVVSL